MFCVLFFIFVHSFFLKIEHSDTKNNSYLQRKLICIFVKVVGISYQAKMNIFGVCIYKPVACPSPKIEKNVWANGGYLIFLGGHTVGK